MLNSSGNRNKGGDVFREWLSDRLRYFILLAALIVAIAAISMFSRLLDSNMNRNNRNMNQSGSASAVKTEKETEGLRSTVAEIVDKYNKRSQAENAVLEAKRKEREQFLSGLPKEIAAALKEENGLGGLIEVYDDFSGAHPEDTSSGTDVLRDFAAAHSEKAVSPERSPSKYKSPCAPST